MKASKNKTEAVQVLDTVSRLWWNGKDFAGKTQAEALAMSQANADELIKVSTQQAIKAGKTMSFEQHGYVSSVELATKAGGEAAAKGLELTHARKLQKLADELIAAIVSTGDKWLKICTYIRENKVAPKLVAHELSQKGLSKVQISKINKVANAPEEHWSKFAARTVGFKKVLELSRGNVQKEIAAQSGQSAIEVEAEVKRMEKDGDGSPGASSGNQAATTDWEAMMVKGISLCLRAAAGMQLPRQRTSDGKNGYVVTIKKAKG